MAVSVIVDESGAHAEARISDARLRRDISESAVAVISQQNVGPHVGDVDVRITGAIVIATGTGDMNYGMGCTCGDYDGDGDTGLVDDRWVWCGMQTE